MTVFYTAGHESATPLTPMTHSRIMYAPMGVDDVIISNELEGFEGNNVIFPDTYSHWKPYEVPADIYLNHVGSTQVTIDCVAIAAHSMAPATVTLYTLDTNNTSWTLKQTVSVTNNKPVMMLFAPTVTKLIRLNISAPINFMIGVIYVGRCMIMPVPAFQTMGMIDLHRKTEFRNNISEGGQWLGRSVARTGLNAGYSWSHISESWYRANFEVFSQRARRTPFFIAARPKTNPEEVAYGWVNSDISPQRMGIKDYLKVGFDMSAYHRE